MDFNEKLKNYAANVSTLKINCNTEESTKHSLILPVLSILGYDVFNPQEVVPEYIADLGIKKGEKIDYAILNSRGEVDILIECKHHTEKLDVHHSQLFRYYAVSQAKFGVLTNGIKYQFFTDLDSINKMDLIPFLEIDMEKINAIQLENLKKFTKEAFNRDEILVNATVLKYMNSMKEILKKDLADPSDEFVKYYAKNILVGRVLNQKTILEFKEIVKLGMNQYISEIVNQKLNNALKLNDEKMKDDEVQVEDSLIITTEDEMEGYYIIKSIASEIVHPDKIVGKDTLSYFGILYDNKVTQWFARLRFTENKKVLALANSDKSEKKIEIESIQDIYKYKNEIVEAIKNYL
jgi:predicted type IV restriction endonuclease